MSGKLDKGLDELVSAQRKTAGRRRTQRRNAGRPATTAPAGGIHKTAKPARGAAAKPAKAAAVPHGDSKVIVSNLPKDVTTQQIKEYFVESVGSVKKVELSYGPNSQSRGIANVVFGKPDGASRAFQKLNGLLVDNRPIKIEIVVGASQADMVIPPTKSLAERTARPKSQPKSAAVTKQTAANTKATAGKAGAAKKRRGRDTRPTKKTAEELDTDMADYFKSGSNNENAPAQAAPAAAAGGDAAMEEDIM